MALYDVDYYKWINSQAEFLKIGRFSNLDIPYLVEELDDLGNSIKRALESHYRVWFCHMLKKKYQPNKATRSWDFSIKNSRLEIDKILRKNPSLKYALPEIMADAYASARLWAADETGLDESVFPTNPPLSLDS